MPQHDYVIADQAGLAFLADLNANLAAIVANNSGATEPTTTYAYMWWVDTTSGYIKQRNAANNAWVSVMPIATSMATTAYADALLGANDAMVFKGVIDCSANPNYPAADAGHVYKVSVAGKIGGASGTNVEAGDTLYCVTDSSASGTQAGVGANWVILQTNVDGAVAGPTSATADAVALFNGTGGKTIKDSAKTLSTDGTLASNSDAKIPTEKAVKTYVDGNGPVKLATVTISAATNYMLFEGLFSSTYDAYFIDFWARPTTDVTEFKGQAGTGGGPTYDTTGNYSDAGNTTASDTGTNTPFGLDGRTYLAITGTQNVGNAATRSVAGRICIYHPSSASLHKPFTWHVNLQKTGGSIVTITGSGRYTSATAMTALRLFFGTAGTNTIAAGGATLWGMPK